MTNTSSLYKLSILQVIDEISAGTISIPELVNEYLTRIKQYNATYNIYLSLNQEAMAQAEEKQHILESLGSTKAFQQYPLLGIPLAIKDNFLTMQFPTTASSKVLDGYMPQYESTVTSRLLKAGAIILGKTNMDAWAHGSSTETSDYGTTRNPWHKDHSPGGSSGGSAAAVAAHLCVAAIGSETAGSVRGPAAWCGITGLKPTYGRVSRYGVIAMASSTDSPGPLTKTVEDSHYLLKIMAGPDPYDATTIKKSYTSTFSSQKANVKNLTFGLPHEYMVSQIALEVRQAIEATAKHLVSLGAKVVPISILDPHYSMSVYTILQRSEVSSNLARFDGIRYGHNRNAFANEAIRRIMLGTYTLSTGYYDQFYAKAQKVRTLILNDFAKAFSTVDLIIGPSMPSTALRVGSSEDQAMFGELADVLLEASSIAGLTGTSIPCGFHDGLPIGLQITGPQQAEDAVLNASVAFQATTDFHLTTPQLSSSASVNNHHNKTK